MRFKLILGLIMAGIVVVFAALNATPVPVNFIFVTRNPPLSILMLVLLAIGVLAGMLLHSLTAKKKEVEAETEIEEEPPKKEKKKKKTTRKR